MDRRKSAQRSTIAAPAAPGSVTSSIRSDWSELSSRAARHPWARPALRSPDAAHRRRVREFFAGHLWLLESTYGPPSLGVRVHLAGAADQLELALMIEDPRQRPLLARGALRGVRDAERLAVAEQRALSARERREAQQ
jgi:hypothetical protein